ncbi:hypothetical protein VOM14_28460 [Paraburkholderia sp. MPAMCS5]|uniref:hypothetical protein n=1 Tax=Paraburkholderia sp. MPAMCS5 TaxID=3112563 RepID=UPI002E17702E|nr:hypothetical protein [Paraburkholderia sp. MPAMCS5]
MKKFVAFVVLACICNAAAARYNDCSAPLPMSVNIHNCTMNPGENWYLTLLSSSFSAVAGYSDACTTVGMGAGVRFRIRNAAGTTNG